MKIPTSHIIIDSGFFVALLNKKDQHHNTAKKVIKTLSDKKWITTWLVLTEVSHILLKKGAYTAIQGMLEVCEKGGITLFHLENSHIPQIKHILKKYQSLPVDLADASLIVLAEELGHGEILSTDMRDFQTYRRKNHKPFTNLFSF